MEKIIGLKQLRANVARYAKQVQKGESFIVVKQSKPLFKISPVVPEIDESYYDSNYKTVIDFTKVKKGGVSIEQIVRAINNVKKDEQARKSHRKTAKKA